MELVKTEFNQLSLQNEMLRKGISGIDTPTKLVNKLLSSIRIELSIRSREERCQIGGAANLLIAVRSSIMIVYH